jgi:hypothetical protein
MSGIFGISNSPGNPVLMPKHLHSNKQRLLSGKTRLNLLWQPIHCPKTKIGKPSGGYSKLRTPKFECRAVPRTRAAIADHQKRARARWKLVRRLKSGVNRRAALEEAIGGGSTGNLS